MSIRFSPLLAFVFVLIAVPATAQIAPGRTFTIGAFAGGTLPVGAWAPRIYDAGAQAGVLAEFQTPLRWLALRVDGRYGRLGNGSQDITDESGTTLGTVSSSTGVMSASANVVVRMPGLRSVVQPYAIAGWSMFQLRSRYSYSVGNERGEGPTLRANGANAGFGVDAPLGRAMLFAEMRYERMGPSNRFVPIMMGAKFR